MMSIPEIDWPAVKCVIFDVDGTLYEQRSLRRRMLRELLAHYARRPWQLSDLLVLRRFREAREKQTAYAGPHLEADQYRWAAGWGYSPARVRAVVERWLLQHPNQFLAASRYPGTREFFAALRERGILLGIYSDYPAQAKLAALELQADVVVSSTDAAVNRLKPHPQGLRHLARQLHLEPGQCLFIGDRPELDGACAQAAGMPYLLVPPQPLADFTFYHHLTHHLSSILNPTLV